jgi:hypothetical protein
MGNLKDVIAKLKAQQNSQQSNKPVEAVKPAKQEIPVEDEMTDEDESDEEMPQETEKPAVKPQKQGIEQSKEEMSREQQIVMEIEMLQNNGRYRAELLHQLQEINRALVVIAGVLVDLAGTEKK